MDNIITILLLESIWRRAPIIIIPEIAFVTAINGVCKECETFQITWKPIKHERTKTIKTYTISRNFGTETRELSHSTFVRYNSKQQVIDSTLYVHNIPLSEKYSYINFNDRKSLKKLKGIERLMHFKYEYSIEGHLVSKYLYGNNNDSLKWREFYKYYSNGKLLKIIRFDGNYVY